MTYRITLSVTSTGSVFMYHSTPNHSEALKLLDSYSKHTGVTAKLERVSYAY